LFPQHPEVILSEGMKQPWGAGGDLLRNTWVNIEFENTP
jgi:hypothetical protein